MRTTLPVVLAVLIALSGILAVGGVSIIRTYTPTMPQSQFTNQGGSPNIGSSTGTPQPPQQQPSSIKLTQQPQTNQTCVGDDCSNNESHD